MMILVAAGSNLPFCRIDSQGVVLNAFFALGRLTEICALSPLYETPAWPDSTDPPFINGVAHIKTDILPEALLHGLHAIEAGFGRKRQDRNAPRTLDLDLIAYDDLVMNAEGGLILPHPRVHQREFVLKPLCDIAPDWSHPVTCRTAKEMLSELGPCQARKIG